jgi:hypothetical protein
MRNPAWAPESDTKGLLIQVCKRFGRKGLTFGIGMCILESNEKPNLNNTTMIDLSQIKTFEGLTFEEFKQSYIADMNDEIADLPDGGVNTYGEDKDYFLILIERLEDTQSFTEMWTVLKDFGRGWEEEGIIEYIQSGDYSVTF